MQSVHAISTTNTNIEVSAMGIRFSGKVSREQWEEIGQQLGKVARSLGFMLGDWLNYQTDNAEFKLEDRYAEAIRLTGHEYKSLKEFSLVAGRIPIDSRVESLSYVHHRIASRLPAESRDYWLGLAAEHGMSTRRLEKSIAAGRVIDVEEMKAAPVQSRIETVHPFINRTLSVYGKMKESGWLKKQSAEQLKRLRQDLEPVRAICEELDELAGLKESF